MSSVPLYVFQLYLEHLTYFWNVSGRCGHAQLFFESAIATLQHEGCTSAIAIPQLFKEMLLHNRNSAIAILSEVRNLRALLPQFLADF